MSLLSRLTTDHVDMAPPFGAVEITVFHARAANENGPGGNNPMPRSRFGFDSHLLGLPGSAFLSGVFAAFVVIRVGHWLGIAS